jgi:hypothetical protein
MAIKPKPKKLQFRVARVLEVFPLSGEVTLLQLVETYNSRFQSRILARLHIDKWFGVLMTEDRMNRILKTLYTHSYLQRHEWGGKIRYSLTARGVQAKLHKSR